jgi:hypothetical protein
MFWTTGVALAEPAPGLAMLPAPVSLAQEGPRPGPGLGPSKDNPSGEPIILILPAGYTLERIQGDSGDVPARAGAFDLALVLKFDAASYQGQSDNRGACASEEEWIGWLLPSHNDQAQNIWVPTIACRTDAGALMPLLDLPVPSGGQAEQGTATVAFSVGGYCVNLDRDPPEEGHSYEVGVSSDDRGLLTVLSMIVTKDLEDFGNISTIQDVIWDYTDFDGLPSENLARLAALR